MQPGEGETSLPPPVPKGVPGELGKGVGTRENGLKGKAGRFRFDKEKKVFAVRVVRHWNRGAVSVPSLKVFEASLDGVLSNLV